MSVGGVFVGVGAPGQTGSGGDLAGPGGNGSAGNGSNGANYGTCQGGGRGDLPTCDPCDDWKSPVSPRTCLAVGTLAKLANGTPIDVDDVKVGDELLGIDDQGDPAPQAVVNIMKFESDCLEIEFDETTVFCSTNHAFIGESISEVYADLMTVGSLILGEDGNLHEAIAITPAGSLTVVAIQVYPNHMFVANGLVHHNKTMCDMVMPYP